MRSVDCAYLLIAINQHLYNLRFDADIIDNQAKEVVNMKRVTVRRLKPFTSYQFRLVAEVEDGYSKTSSCLFSSVTRCLD